MLLSFDILKKNIDVLNKINIFPVADGDTGRNLYNVVKNLEGIDFGDLQEFLSKAVDISMENGTGCSGNILSLFIMGLYQNRLDDYTEMCRKASEFAWNTMYEPQEGTILTAMKDVPEHYDSIEDFIYQYIQNTYKNLMEGPDLLSVLKENNTLDSGTLGFLYILCDIYRCMTGEDISPNIDLSEPSYIVNEDSNDRYCMEFQIKVKDGELKNLLVPFGSELICLSSKDFTKIHIHTDDYLKIYDICRNNGKIVSYKIEDMQNNNRRIYL